MSDPFRRLFLDMLELILKKKPSPETQLELLQLATPGLDESTLSNRSETTKLFRTLLIRVHPDKHPKEVERSTRLCQDAKIFYDKCRVASPEPLRKKRRKSQSPKSVAFPLKFKSNQKWPHIGLSLTDGKESEHNCAEMTCLVAYQCINARGAIAHGKKVERFFSAKQAIEVAKQVTVTNDVFKKFGGTKEMSGPDEIKEEIMKSGPVISTSFEPNGAFLNHNTALRRQQEFLIVGWTMQPAGEVWIIAPLHGLISTNSYVSFGQFGIDDCCVAPVSSLDNFSWESGPYFDIDMAGVDENWRTSWTSLQHSVSDGISAFEPFLKELGTINITGGQPKLHYICIRDKRKHAHSRRGRLRSIEWVDKKWKIVIDF